MVRWMIPSCRNPQVALMRETTIHGGIGKINPTANVAHTIGIAKPGKIAEKGKEELF